VRCNSLGKSVSTSSLLNSEGGVTLRHAPEGANAIVPANWCAGGDSGRSLWSRHYPVRAPCVVRSRARPLRAARPLQ
jgi:hypothetical protein